MHLRSGAGANVPAGAAAVAAAAVHEAERDNGGEAADGGQGVDGGQVGAAFAPPFPPQLSASGSPQLSAVIASASGDAALVALQQLMQMQMQQQAASLAQQAKAAQDSSIAAAAMLAQQRRVAAGPPATFSGKQVRGIEVYAWLAAMERWFEATHMVGPGSDAERVLVAATALRDMAQLWWSSLSAPGAAAGPAPTTWATFKDAITRQYQPQAPERWAMQQLRELVGKDNRDVAVYTARVLELYQLLPHLDELSRVMRYEEGLPEFYRVRCAEKQHSTLHAATEATLALWNAKVAAGGPVRGVTQLRHTETEGEEGQPTAASATTAAPGGGAATHRVAPAQTDLAQMFAMMMDWQSRKDGGSGTAAGKKGSGAARGGREGRQRARGGRREGAPDRSRSPGGRHLSDEVFKARWAAQQCFKCGGEGHRAFQCDKESDEEGSGK